MNIGGLVRPAERDPTLSPSPRRSSTATSSRSDPPSSPASPVVASVATPVAASRPKAPRGRRCPRRARRPRRGLCNRARRGHRVHRYVGNHGSEPRPSVIPANVPMRPQPSPSWTSQNAARAGQGGEQPPVPEVPSEARGRRPTPSSAWPRAIRMRRQAHTARCHRLLPAALPGRYADRTFSHPLPLSSARPPVAR